MLCVYGNVVISQTKRIIYSQSAKLFRITCFDAFRINFVDIQIHFFSWDAHWTNNISVEEIEVVSCIMFAVSLFYLLVVVKSAMKIRPEKLIEIKKLKETELVSHWYGIFWENCVWSVRETEIDKIIRDLGMKYSFLDDTDPVYGPLLALAKFYSRLWI